MASNALVARLVGGILLAAGVLMTLLGGLCTSWFVAPAMVESLGQQGLLRTLGDLWLPLAGGAATMIIGLLLARVGLRRIRHAGGGSGRGEDR